MNVILFCRNPNPWWHKVCELPLALLPVGGAPLLAHVLLELRENGVRGSVCLIGCPPPVRMQFGDTFADFRLSYADQAPARVQDETLWIESLSLLSFSMPDLQNAHHTLGADCTCLTIAQGKQTGYFLLRAGAAYRQKAHSAALRLSGAYYPLQTPEEMRTTLLHLERGHPGQRNQPTGQQTILSGCWIAPDAHIHDAVFAENALVLSGACLEEGSRIEAGCVIGQGSHIGKRAWVKSGVCIHQGAVVDADAVVSFDVCRRTQPPMQVEEEGVCGVLTPQRALRLGGALTVLGKQVLIAYEGTDGASRALALSACTGVASAGGNAVLVGECTITEAAFGAHLSHSQSMLHLDPSYQVRVRMEGGLPLDREHAARLSAALGSHQQPAHILTEYGAITDGGVFVPLYVSHLQSLLPSPLPLSLTVSSAHPLLCRLGQRVFGSPSEQGAVLQLSSDGEKLSLYSDETGFVSPERLLLLGCLDAFDQGEDVALPDWAPLAAHAVAKAHARRILRMSEDAPSDPGAQEQIARQRFSFDGMELAARILRCMATRGCTLSQLLQSLPPLATVTRTLSTDADPANVCLPEQSEQQGHLRIRRSFSGNRLILYAEAECLEAASELCHMAEQAIQRTDSLNQADATVPDFVQNSDAP